MPGTEGYDDPYNMYTPAVRPRGSTRGRGRASKARVNNYSAIFEGSSRGDGSCYRNDFGVKEEDNLVSNRKRIKASHYDNFIKKYPGGTAICILCRMGSNHASCQGLLKWFSVKSKRGPGRPCSRMIKSDKFIASFISSSTTDPTTPKIFTLKTDLGPHAEPIKIKIDTTLLPEKSFKKQSSLDMTNGNGFRKEDEGNEGLGFYIHVECCRWTFGVTPELEMFKAEKYILKGLGQVCTYCNACGATVSCKADNCKKRYHLVCGILARCVPNLQSATLVCHDHMGMGGLQIEARCSKCTEDVSHESMLHCSTCGAHTHQQCLPADVQLKPLVVAGWQCDNCRMCQACTRHSAVKLIDCFHCLKPYHIDCVVGGSEPKWRCRVCKYCADCGDEVPLIFSDRDFSLPFILCKDCYSLRIKGFSCCICHKAYNIDKRDLEVQPLRCDNCRNIVHHECDCVDPEQLDSSNIYLCPMCRLGGRNPIISKASLLGPAENGGMPHDEMDENSQDSMSIASENDEYSVTPMSSSHTSPGSSSLDSYYTVVPKKGRGIGIKLARPTSARKIPKFPSGEQSFQEKRDGVLQSEVVLFNESDQYTLSKDMCRVCGSFGSEEESYLLGCAQCGQCYHPFCVNKSVNKIMMLRGWRCSECVICEGCGNPGDGERLLLCEDCDISIHIYCLSPALDAVPSGLWRCSWCVKCQQCGSTSPGLHATWYQDYTLCGPCHTKQMCLVCAQEYNIQDFLVQCAHCDHWSHGKCEDIHSEEDSTKKKFVCGLCEDLVKKEEKPCRKAFTANFGVTKKALSTAINRDARIAAYKQKDEKDFEAEREELESNRLLGYEYVKAMNKQRAEFNMKQVGGRKMKRPRKLPMQLQSSEIAAFEFEDKEEKPNTLLEEALTPPKEMSSSRLYQQLIRELTGSMHQSKCTNKRGRGRGAAKYGVVSPNKDPNAPRMRGRPRGSRNKMPSQRRGSGKLSPDMIGAMREDESMNFAEYQLGAKGGYDKNIKPDDDSPLSKEALLSTVPYLPQRYREIMMRDGGNDAQELNISRHPNMKDAPGRGGLQIDPLRTMPPGPPRAPLKRSNSAKVRGKNAMTPGTSLEPSPIKTEDNLKSNHELAAFFGEDLVPRPEMMSPMTPAPLAPPMLTSPTVKPSMKPMLMKAGKQALKQHSMQRTPAASPKTLSKPGTPIKQEPPPVFDEVNNICPESPGPPPPSASLPDYNNRELVHKRPVFQAEVEEEEANFEAVSSFFGDLFGEDLDLDESSKGSPIFDPPDPNAEQLTMSKTEGGAGVLDDLEGELPSEVHAILESVEEKPMGTEIDDIEPTISPKEEAPRSVPPMTPGPIPSLPPTPLEGDIDVPDDLLKEMDGFSFFVDDLTMKKLEEEQRQKGPGDKSDFDKILEPPSAASKRAAENTARSLKNWEEEEKKGAAGTNAQLLYANSELSHLRLQYKESAERYKVIMKMWRKLSAEDRKMYLNTAKKNKARKATTSTEQEFPPPQFDPAASQPPYMQPAQHASPSGDPDKDAELRRQTQLRQRLYERQMSKGEMVQVERERSAMLWQRFGRPDDNPSATVTVGPIPSGSAGTPNLVPSAGGPMTPGPMTPAPMTPGPMTPGHMTGGPMTPGPMTPGPNQSPMSMAPSPMNPVGVQMIHQPGPMMMRHYEQPHPGQWSHTGASTPLRHLPPQGMPPPGHPNYMEYMAQDQPPPTPGPAKPKKRQKKKKEKVTEPEIPIPEPQVNLENLPPHLRFGNPQAPPIPQQGDFPPPSPAPGMAYPEQYRQGMAGMQNPYNKPGTSPMMKSPGGLPADLDRPRSLNIANSPSTSQKSHPGTPNKASRTSSPGTKPEFAGERGPETMGQQQQQAMAQQNSLRAAIERQHSYKMNQHMMALGQQKANLHYPLSIPQFIQYRLQQEWLKRYMSYQSSGGAGNIPPPPHHPTQLSPQQKQIIYNQLMQQYMVNNSMSANNRPPPQDPSLLAAAEIEEKKPKPKKRKKKKAEPIKKEDKAKMCSPMGPMKVNSPGVDPSYAQQGMPHHMMGSGIVNPHQVPSSRLLLHNPHQAQLLLHNPRQAQLDHGCVSPHLTIVKKHLNMRSPGPALIAGPHVRTVPGQLHRLMAQRFAVPHPENPEQHTHPQQLNPMTVPHFHEESDLDPPKTPNKSAAMRTKPKTQKDPLEKVVKRSTSNESLSRQSSLDSLPMQGDPPRYQYHQIKIEDTQDLNLSEPKTPQPRSKTNSSASTPTGKDPLYDNPPFTPMSNEMYSQYALENAKRRKRRTKAEMDEIRAERERKGLPPIRHTNKNIPTIIQPDIGNMVDIVCKGYTKKNSIELKGHYGHATIESVHDYYKDIIMKIKRKQLIGGKSGNKVSESKALLNDKNHSDKEVLTSQQQALANIEKVRASLPSQHTIPQTVLTPQQEKILCQKFGVTPAEAQQMYYYQQAQHMMSLRDQQLKAYHLQNQMDQARATEAGSGEKNNIVEQIRQLQEAREKPAKPIKQEQNVSISVKQQSDQSIQLIFQRPGEEDNPHKASPSDTLPLKPYNKPMLQLTKPTPPMDIKQELLDGSSITSPATQKDLPFAITGPDFMPPPTKSSNPPTDEKTTRVINLHKAFQMLSDMLGMKLKKDNLSSLNELRVQNIIPGTLPHNLICYNCVVALHPNKLQHLVPGRPYYGIKDEHGATFCGDNCLAQYYCKKFSSLYPNDMQGMAAAQEDPKQMLLHIYPPPLKQQPSHKPYIEKASSPGKRRREEIYKWRYFKEEDMSVSPASSQLDDDATIMEMLSELHHQQSIQSSAPDCRLCILCGATGDGKPQGASRLLNIRKDVWIHLNCALWSTEVYETREGGLVNVPQACKRSQDTACAYCSRVGATITCAKSKCTRSYHFLCGRHSQCAFYQDKTMMCPAHKTGSRTCTDFSVRRRVCVEKDIQQLLSTCSFKDTGDKMRVGSLIFHHPGHILNNVHNFHDRNIIYPFDYSATRFYWSTEKLKTRCRYDCAIGIKDDQPLFKLSYTKNNKLIESEGLSSVDLWKDVVLPVSELRTKDTIKLHTSFHPGNYLHGLTEKNILRIIEGLPGTDKLEGYTFCYGRIETVTIEHLVVLNPTGVARTEKYTKHSKSSHSRGASRQVSSSAAPSSKGGSSWPAGLAEFEDMLPYQKTFNRASQYRRLKTEWQTNVLLRRSAIQGLGLYARKFIERNTMLIEYVGQLIRTCLTDRREDYYNSRNMGCYMFKIDDEVTVDATMTGGPARYINHSCDPNCQAEIVTFEREKKIIIISSRKIREGEELTYDYKFDYEDETDKIPCNCGAYNCRHWMN